MQCDGQAGGLPVAVKGTGWPDEQARLLRSPGRGPQCQRGGSEEGLSPLRDEAPPRPQPRRQERRGRVQGVQGGLRGAERRRQAPPVRPARARRLRARHGRRQRRPGLWRFRRRRHGRHLRRHLRQYLRWRGAPAGPAPRRRRRLHDGAGPGGGGRRGREDHPHSHHGQLRALQGQRFGRRQGGYLRHLPGARPGPHAARSVHDAGAVPALRWRRQDHRQPVQALQWQWPGRAGKDLGSEDPGRRG